MVRRLSEAWKRQNENGVFAERCFVLERNAGTGELSVREEFPIEAGSRATTPESDDNEREFEEENDDEEEEEEDSAEEDEEDEDEDQDDDHDEDESESD